MMLRFADPPKLKTKKVVFEETYFARDPGTLEQLKELSSCRRVIEESINNRSLTTKAVAREMSGGATLQCEQDIQKLEKYLPLLENLVHVISLAKDNSQLVRWTKDLKIRWSSALASSTLFKSQKFFQIDKLLFEVNMMLFLYGALLRECAFDVQSTDLVQSATLFRKAAGVYHTLAQEVIPPIQASLASERPPESTSSLSSVMSLICLAEAQAATIKKAEEKGTTGSLLGKLHYGVVQILGEAAAIIHSARTDFKEISVHLVEFISLSKVIHELRSYKYLAECLRTDNQIGVALGVLRHALTSAQKNKQPGKESWRLVVKQEIDSMSEMLRKFEHENNFVWNDKVPPHHDLPLPEGKRIVNLIPYNRQRLDSPLSFKI